MSNYPPMGAFTRFPEPAPEDYYSETDLEKGVQELEARILRFAEVEFDKLFPGAVFNSEAMRPAIRDGLSDATAPFFTEIVGG